MPSKISILLFQLGFGIKFNIIGVLSASEIFLLIYAFSLIKKIRCGVTPEIRKITYLYLGLLFAQIASEFFVGNSLHNILRGIAITIISYLHTRFLYDMLLKNKNSMIWIIVGSILLSIINADDFKENILSLLSGDNAAYLKFYLSPLIINLLLLYTLSGNRKHIVLLAIVIGTVFVAFGARSAGVQLILASIIYAVLKKRKRLNLRNVFWAGLSTCSIFYMFYVIYVNKVLSNEITAGNSSQLHYVENPYNPINLLLMGRAETFVGWMAFMDRFWTGYGAWAVDTAERYYHLLLMLHNESGNGRSNDDDYLINAHSVLVGAGTTNGIFAFIFMFLINGYILKIAFKSIDITNRSFFISVFFIIALLWNVLFSPQSHFRLTLPLYYATFLYLYKMSQMNKNIACVNERNISCNSYVREKEEFG